MAAKAAVAGGTGVDVVGTDVACPVLRFLLAVEAFALSGGGGGDEGDEELDKEEDDKADESEGLEDELDEDDGDGEGALRFLFALAGGTTGFAGSSSDELEEDSDEVDGEGASRLRVGLARGVTVFTTFFSISELDDVEADCALLVSSTCGVRLIGLTRRF